MRFQEEIYQIMAAKRHIKCFPGNDYSEESTVSDVILHHAVHFNNIIVTKNTIYGVNPFQLIWYLIGITQLTNLKLQYLPLLGIKQNYTII